MNRFYDTILYCRATVLSPKAVVLDVKKSGNVSLTATQVQRHHLYHGVRKLEYLKIIWNAPNDLDYTPPRWTNNMLHQRLLL